MAEGFEEPYHVPQQSRRDKLREGCALHHADGAGLLPLPSDLLTCAVDPFFYSGQSQPMVYRPEQLSLSLSSQDRLPVQSFVAGSSSGGGLGRSTVPLGPFTGYASILKGSRFLRPAREMMEEICDVARGGVYDVAGDGDGDMGCGPGEVDLGGGEVADDVAGGGEGRRRKCRLISMLDEVYKRYKYYYQQMQAVVASFESVPGISNAAPFANLALKAMSKHFKTLKNAITEQLRFGNKSYQNSRKGENTVLKDSDGTIRFGQRPIQNMGLHDNQPIWRPQRGLPERAVTMLRAWLFDHFLHPYPTDTDKMMLAKQTGLSRNQVSNWFINARVRLWKPMVEEIHNLETRQAQNSSQQKEQITDMPNSNFPPSTTLGPQNPSAFASKTLDLPSKRAKNVFHGMSSNGTEEPMCSYYEHVSNHQVLVGGGSGTPSGTGNVSLTLGLHQNHGIGISEPFPINAARRFGLDANSQGYVLGDFETQDREFGRSVVSAQLFHDFVG